MAALTHPEAGTITREELIARAKAMLPALRERAAATEEARRLLPETLRDFRDAGFFRICQPKRFGGFELGLDVLEEVMIEVGRGCGSSAWNLAVLGGHNWWIGAGFPEEAQAEIYGAEGDSLMPVTFSPNGSSCRRVDGGYEVTGRWPFMSGIDVANWFGAASMVVDDPGAPTGDAIIFAAPIDQGRIEDDWFVLGMRGTGSKTIATEALFVPERRAIPAGCVEEQEMPGALVNPDPLYRAPLRAYLTIEVAGAAVGTALQACDALDEIMRTKPVRQLSAAAGDTKYQMEVPAMRYRLAAAQTLAATAQALLVDEARGVMARLHEYAPRGQKFSREEIAEVGLNVARVIDLCVESVSHAFADAGTSAAVDGHPLQRCLRDIYMISSHAALRMDAATEAWGLAHFGLTSPFAVRRTLSDVG